MTRDPKDLPRYTGAERANHWLVAICVILLSLSGLALFHPAFWPLNLLFGGGTWLRILHPYIGIVMAISFVAMFGRFLGHNAMTAADWDWLGHVGEMAGGDDSGMPAQGKYNGGQKLIFWIFSLCILVLLATGIAIWRAWLNLPVGIERLAVVLHAIVAALMMGFLILHIYAALWTRGSLRGMWYGSVTRAWARQHHRDWYRRMTGDQR
jgi:formate dehydrogenase subunit gamma